MIDSKACTVCGKIYHRKVGREGYEVFSKRKYCSRACVSEGLKKEVPFRTCDCCGKSFQRPDKPSDLKRTKTFCSPACHKKSREKKKNIQCLTCKTFFAGYGNRKYCCRTCYQKSPTSWHRNRMFIDLPDRYTVYEIADALAEYM